MAKCLKCGGSGLWLTVNEDGVCDDCSHPKDTNRNTLTVLGNFGKSEVAIRAEGSALVYSEKGQETAIPISKIQDLILSPPKNLFHGSLKIVMARSPSGFMAITSSFTMALGSSKEVFFASNTEYEFAKNIREYVNNYNIQPQVTTAPGSTSPTSALRELKSLVDDGVITQEEFDAKKKQLLGL